ncbi:MAG TPA: hypothetical protein VGP27_07865, partial [Mycobacterium sp.]|nr:hypothetical protein [Mycobacterium sp.]
LVSETKDATGEQVHVQTMATNSHRLPAYDPTGLSTGVLWQHADRDVKLESESAQDRARRASAAREELARRIGGQASAVVVGHLAGGKPRATRGAAGEDAAGHGAGHINARHVIGQSRIDTAPPALGTTVTPDWLAYRAVTNNPPCGGMAGGFANAGAAAAGIQAAATQLTIDWPAFRDRLIVNGRVQEIVPVAGAGICFLRTANTAAAQLLPAWLGGPTNRKLHAQDTRATDEPPLADSSAPSGTELRILLSPTSPNGWFVHSAWPTI